MCAPFKDPNMLSKFAEIGSEFWIEEMPEKLLTERDGVYALSGRTAIDLILQDIMKKRPIRSVLMPAWCCDSMLAPFLDGNIDVRFYDVILGTQITTNKDELSIKYSLSNTDLAEGTDILYLTNYFGYENTLSLETVRRYKEQGSIILYDRTHSFLMDDEPYSKAADYTFASIRKWMGVVGGAVVNGLSEKPSLKDCPYAPIREVAMRDKYRYLQGDKHIEKQNFLNAFGEFGHHLAADYRDYEMDSLSFTLYKQEDLAAMKVRRKENAAFLHSHLKGVRFLGELTDGVVPLFVPVFFKNKEQRNSIRKHLMEHQIYCPVHWPKPQQIPTGYQANEIYDTELSLICDQRYGIEKMERIVKRISEII